MKLFVEDLNRKTVAVEVDPDATIAEVKRIVREKTGETKDFLLMFQGEPLGDSETLRDRSIQGSGQRLNMAQAVQGGV